MKQSINKENFAVVTGASQGLGKAFARELAGIGKNVILISLPGQGLTELSEEIKKEFDVRVEYYETNFTSDDNTLRLAQWLNNNFPIDILINNAGIGGTKKIDEASIDYINTIIQVNVKATSLLTHQLLPNLKRRNRAFILNVSSIAAFSPVGYKTVYPASKAFVHSFSRGLNEELKDTSVFVSVINPGAMATNDEITSRIEKQGMIGKLTLLKPEKVASYAIKRLLKRDSVIIVNHITWLMSALLPIWIKLPMMTRIIKREINYGNSIRYGNKRLVGHEPC